MSRAGKVDRPDQGRRQGEGAPGLQKQAKPALVNCIPAPLS
jgi:hypothetical protein